MSGNTSATGGYLQPTSAEPTIGATLASLMQDAVASMTGLPRSMVRPRWQPLPPQQPAADIDWCGVGVISQRGADFPYITHNQAGDGSDTLIRQLEVDAEASFYGPNCLSLAERLRDGFYIPQNLEKLGLAGIKLFSIDDVVHAPEQVNNQWIDRADLAIRLRLAVSRTYAVLHIVSTQTDINTSTGLVNSATSAASA